MASIRRLVLPLVVLAPLLLMAAVRPAHAQTAPVPALPSAPAPPLCDRIAAVVRAHPALTAAVVFVDLRTGARCDLEATRTFRTASLYKPIVLAELYRQRSLGALSLDDPITLEPRHSVDDPPSLRLTEAVTVTLVEAARRMIEYSDNAAALALRERLGFAAVDAAPAQLGMTQTRLGAEFVTTAADQARLLAALYHGRVAGSQASADMLAIMRAQEVNSLIPAGVGDEVPIAHKTGTVDGLLHDVGVVYAPGGDYLLAVLTDGTDYMDAVEAITGVSAVVFQAYAQPPARSATLARNAQGAAATVPAGPAGARRPAAEGVPAPAPPRAAPAGEGPLPRGRLLVLGPSLGSGAAETLRGLALALATAAITLAAAVWIARRPLLQAIGHGRLAVLAHARPAARHGRSAIMRFGGRKDDDGKTHERGHDVLPASRSAVEVGLQPVLPSKRLQRVAEHFHTQAELLTTMRQQFEAEMEPLHELLVHQAATMQRMLANLEERLRPLNEYADGEEANLDALERRMNESGSDHVARSFADYLADQRARISGTRGQIDQQRLPFLQYGEEQRDAVEVALSRFDGEIEALELNLAEQRKVMMRMLDSMRSDAFSAVKEFLLSRQEALGALATSGSTDPAEIGRSVQQLRRGLEPLAGDSPQIRAVLDRVDQADKHMVSAAPTPTRPRALATNVDRDDQGASA